MIVPPQDRAGLVMDSCGVAPPVPREAGVLRPATATASCDGEPIVLGELAPGAWSTVLDVGLPVGSRCEVTLDGERIELPDLLPWPDLESSLGGLSWTPAGGDELRVVVPLPSGDLATCRLSDDGRGPKPRHLARHTAFATRQAYALARTEAGRIGVSVASGIWLRRGRTTTEP